MLFSGGSAGVVISLVVLSLFADARLRAGERAPAIALTGLSGEKVGYDPPPQTSKGADGDAAAPKTDATVTVIVFIDPGQDQSIEALDDLRAFLAKSPDAAGRTGALAILTGSIEDPDLQRLRERFPEGPLRFAIDKERTVYRRYGVIALPTTFVIDGRGTIIEVMPGRSAAYGRRLSSAVLGALGLERETPEESVPVSPAVRKAARMRKLAESLIGLGKYRPAAAQLRLAVGLDPSNPDLLTMLGEVLLELSDAPAASREFEKALAAAPDHRRARTGLAIAISLGDDLDAGEKALRAELKAPHPDPELLYHLGKLLARKGEMEGAAAAFREAYERLRRDR